MGGRFSRAARLRAGKGLRTNSQGFSTVSLRRSALDELAAIKVRPDTGSKVDDLRFGEAPVEPVGKFQLAKLRVDVGAQAVDYAEKPEFGANCSPRLGPVP